MDIGNGTGTASAIGIVMVTGIIAGVCRITGMIITGPDIATDIRNRILGAGKGTVPGCDTAIIGISPPRDLRSGT